MHTNATSMITKYLCEFVDDSNLVAVDAPVLPAVTDADLDKETFIRSFFNDHVISIDPALFRDSFSKSLLSAIRQNSSPQPSI